MTRWPTASTTIPSMRVGGATVRPCSPRRQRLLAQSAGFRLLHPARRRRGSWRRPSTKRRRRSATLSRAIIIITMLAGPENPSRRLCHETENDDSVRLHHVRLPRPVCRRAYSLDDGFAASVPRGHLRRGDEHGVQVGVESGYLDLAMLALLAALTGRFSKISISTGSRRRAEPRKPDRLACSLVGLRSGAQTVGRRHRF
jgi:hypothetical protein